MSERYPNSANILKKEDASGSPTRGILNPVVLEHLKSCLIKKNQSPTFEKGTWVAMNIANKDWRREFRFNNSRMHKKKLR
jgi:hypothetical protein